MSFLPHNDAFGEASTPFVVLALPRSRTKWLSEFLTYGPWRCSHEEAKHFRSMEDVASWVKQPWCGSVETAIGPFWRTIPKNVHIVVVRRDPGEVERSLRQVMTTVPSSLSCHLKYLDAKLNQVERRVSGALSVTYESLATAEGAQRVFEFALGIAFDREWWEMLRGVNVQERYTTFERYVAAHAPQLRRMAGLAKGAALQELATQRHEALDGITFAEEPFEVFLRDGVRLFVEHAHVVGEVPEAFHDKNIPLGHALAAQGSLQIIVARSNGRMFGYLMTEFAPSRESPGKIVAVETTFFASSDVPGLGMRLQRETLRVLREKRISEVWFRAGVRGSGTKLDTMYKRIGAVPAGSLWKLDLLPQEGSL